MNLFLTTGCNERCSFCYAETYFQTTGKPADGGRVLEHLARYAELVRAAEARGELPAGYDQSLDEETRTLYSARTINLLGGEPTLHPDFERIVRGIQALGLGAIVFTNASRPERILAVQDALWTVVVNGHFAERAPGLGLELQRVHANLPLQPGQDPIAALERVRAAGIKTLYLAFAAPAGGPPGDYFTPDDLEAMQAVHRSATEFCAEAGIFLAYDCSFPVCVDEARTLGAKCTSVPILDAEGMVTICGGEYLHEAGRRPLSEFRSVRELHAYTYRLIQGLRALPSRFGVCNDCRHFNEACHGMCLAYRERPAAPARLPLA